jgi:hypothetical protein
MTDQPYRIVFNRLTGVDWRVIRVRDGAAVFSAYTEQDCRRWVRAAVSVDA